ncbi:DUF453-domain-containing protein [Fistulina hepatica ATCC 64428]|uniref:DUF453-domain-containing protein n=1 Tax=Fistulina hepatica ATCC 64428 TaxID=1128425 RepID=A0A0D7AIW8_9AGAR|nr:DUF453-domain-containing protein [Fistulina hepatica ATCC 64428]
MRGGTSKGIFLNRSSLPADNAAWKDIFLRIMGSPDPYYGRQLNGMGGGPFLGVSSLSKICVVGEPSDQQKLQGIHAEYTFVQVGIRDDTVDYSGNCGNLTSMIGVYALDACIHLIDRTMSRTTVRTFNTNTQKIIDTAFPVSEGVACLDIPEISIAGVPGKASQIMMDFIDPAGARTGSLLPTGNVKDVVSLHEQDIPLHVPVSLVDATNPSVFVCAADLRLCNLAIDDYLRGDSATLLVAGVLESIRQQGAVMMRLDPKTQAQPKIAILDVPVPTDEAHISVYALSMGVLHKAVPMTLGLCLGVSANIPGTIPWEIARARGHERGQLVNLRHPGGIVQVGSDSSAGDDLKPSLARVTRTGRRLMEGKVFA